MIITKLLQTSIEELLKIEKEIFPNPWKYEDFHFMILNSDFNFLLKDKGKIIGYFCSLITGNIIHITNFAIVKKYQNKGIGYLFFNTLLQFFIKNNSPTFFLEVRKSNKKAIHLYKKLGFNIVKVIQNYYKQPKEDAFVMVKK